MADDLRALIDEAEGDTLTVPAGRYPGPLELTKPVQLDCAEGAVLTGTLTISADVTVSGLEVAPPADAPAIVVEAGTVTLEGCTIHGGSTGLAARGESRVELRKCEISGGGKVGAAASDRASLTLRHTAIRGRDDDLVVISDQARCLAHGCTLAESAAATLWVRPGGHFRAEVCELERTPNGAQIEGEGARVELWECQLRDAVWISDGAHGDLVDCSLEGPADQLIVSSGGEVVLTGCRLTGGTTVAAQAQRGGRLSLTDCELTGNKQAVLALDGCAATVVDCRLHDNYGGVVLEGSAEGEVRGCDFSGHEDAAIGAHQRSQLGVFATDIHDEALGIGLVGHSRVVLEDVAIFGEISSGYIAVLPDVQLEVRSLRIADDIYDAETATQRLVEYVDLQPARPDHAYVALGAGADLAAAGKGGITALMGAARRGQLDFSRVLLAAGASVDRRDDQGRSAIDWARTPEPDNPRVTDSWLADREETQERVLCALGDCVHHEAPATPERIPFRAAESGAKSVAELRAALWTALVGYLEPRLTAACRPAAEACWGEGLPEPPDPGDGDDALSFPIREGVDEEARALGEHWLRVALAGAWRNSLAPVARRHGYRLFGRPSLDHLWLADDAPSWVEVEGALVEPQEDETRGIPEENDIARAAARHGVCGCPVCGDSGCGLVRNLRVVGGYTPPPLGHRWVQARFFTVDGALDGVTVEKSFVSRERAAAVVDAHEDTERQTPRGHERSGHRLLLEHGVRLFHPDGSPFTGP